MNKIYAKNLLVMLFMLLTRGAFAGEVLINFNFQTATLPAGVSSNNTTPLSGTITKAADGVCSKGMIQINKDEYLQVDLTSCGAFTLNMKSTSASSTRTVTIRYKKNGAADYTLASSTIPVLGAASFNIATLFPEILSTGPISVRIIPTTGNLQIHDLYAEATNSLSSAAEITEFKISGQLGTEVINTSTGTIAVNVPMGVSLTAVVPQVVTLSDQATISPVATTARDFSGEVIYTVTAQDGLSSKTWKVNVTPVASTLKEITAFKLSNEQIGDASINSAAGTITVIMPQSADLTNLSPLTLTISNYATVNPLASTARDFSQTVSYTVTAQDNSSKTWQVTVNKVDPNAVYYDFQAETAEFTGKVDSQHANYTGTGFVDFLAGGENSIIFTVCQPQAGTQTAKFRYSLAKDELRTGSLYVNDTFVKYLDFPRTALFTEWNEEIVVLSLNAGVNKIKITWETTDGPNLDKLALTGVPCTSYTLSVSGTNSGNVTFSPARTDNKYFEGETVTLLAESKPNLAFANWTGDLTGNTNPVQVVMNSDKTIAAHFNTIATYKLNITKSGIGDVEISPAGGEYTAGTVVNLTAKSVLGSTFQGWAGALSGTSLTQSITMDADKNITATFTSNISIDFNKVVGFASVSADNFTGPTTGGTLGSDTVFINGPSDFPNLCQVLQDRIKYKSYHNRPLTIVLEEGVYTGANGTTASWANSMLSIQEQGDLTLIGRKNVVFNFGINIKRGWNIIIRNISFQDYYDDGINIGEPETHHIWIDHCTVGHPTTMPADHEHPDGGIDVKAGASYVTISWTKYRNSWKTGLVGHSDSNGAEDTGRLKVTYYCNYFYHTNSRNPRVRFGQVHTLNNLEEHVQLYGMVAANSAEVYAENNFFLNTRWAMYADRSTADFKTVFGNNTDDGFTSKTGNYPAKGLKQVGNEYDDSGLPVITSQINPAMLNPGGRSVKFDELNPTTVFDPKSYYSYDVLPASAVRTIVPMFAGANMVDFFAKPSSLPLKLVSFKASLTEGLTKEVKVSWSTTNEVNTKNFVVERSADGKHFMKQGELPAKNISGLNSYSFTDITPLPATSYYRLKQIDLDGAFSYSSIISVENVRSAILAVYPNPASHSVNITHAEAASNAVISITNLHGRKVFSLKPAKGTTLSKDIDVSMLPPGNYILAFLNGSVKSSVKFIKQ